MSGLQVADLDEEIYNNISQQDFKSGKGTSFLNFLRFFLFLLVLVDAAFIQLTDESELTV